MLYITLSIISQTYTPLSLIHQRAEPVANTNPDMLGGFTYIRVMPLKDRQLLRYISRTLHVTMELRFLSSPSTIFILGDNACLGGKTVC